MGEFDKEQIFSKDDVRVVAGSGLVLIDSLVWELPTRNWIKIRRAGRGGGERSGRVLQPTPPAQGLKKWEICSRRWRTPSVGRCLGQQADSGRGCGCGNMPA
jgi:hypothetical protein